MALEKILGNQFETEVREAFRKILGRSTTDESLFQLDEARLKTLVTHFNPHSSNKLPQDFIVASCDGSGIENLCHYEDNHLQLVDSALVVLDSNTKANQPMKFVDLKCLSSLNDGFLLKVFSFNHDAQDFRESYLDFLESLLSDTDLLEVFWKYYYDTLIWEGNPPEIYSKDSLVQNIGDEIEKYLIFRRPGQSYDIHRDLRNIIELILIRRAVLSDLKIKYVILDGSLTILEPIRGVEKGKPIARPMSDYLLRDICYQAREKNIILVAVSKVHTIPGTLQIAGLASSMGAKDHWFCRIPGHKDKDGELNLTKPRRYIPPELATTYLARFYHLMPVFRIDFDYFWWSQNIRNADPALQRENEIKIFQDLDFMAHEARYYGYPCPPAFAHDDCVITWEDQLIAADRVVEIGKSLGLNERALISPRRFIFK
ncbi:MAG: hypothetical protein HWN66_13190 [Candidatus Helarchaeota archaeon]|nr:hypothetical protein [Candidatus Helarchaeota archaeon]